jgi:hypothetical protein
MQTDPFSPEVARNPYPVYAQLRRSAPVCWIERLQAWAVSRYEDVERVAGNPELFSSAPIVKVLLGEFNPAPEAPSLISLDPPAHIRMRRLANKAFTPKMVAGMEPRIRMIVEELLDGISGRDDFDFVRDFTIPFPLRVIAEMLGVEPERYLDFKRWSDDVIRPTGGPMSEAEKVRSRQSSHEFREYFERAIEERRTKPREDLISELVRAQEERQALTAEEVMGLCVLLLIAGNETTTNLLGNTMVTLLRHPEDLAKVRADRTLIPMLIEEILRYESPVQSILRQATRDTEIAGVKLPVKSLILMIFASANRDERKYPAADRFDLMRNPQDHFGFGSGIHYCLGAPLSRLEARVAIDAVLSRFSKLAAKYTEVTWTDSFVVRGPKALPLGWRL